MSIYVCICAQMDTLVEPDDVSGLVLSFVNGVVSRAPPREPVDFVVVSKVVPVVVSGDGAVCRALLVVSLIIVTGMLTSEKVADAAATALLLVVVVVVVVVRMLRMLRMLLFLLLLLLLACHHYRHRLPPVQIV